MERTEDHAWSVHKNVHGAYTGTCVEHTQVRAWSALSMHGVCKEGVQSVHSRCMECACAKTNISNVI